MTEDSIDVFPLLDFLRRAEGLKSTLRTTWMRDGRRESSAEHSWRLSLFAMVVAHRYPELDGHRVLQLCVVHDLGETINGDIPAPEQTGDKTDEERRDMEDLLRPLPASLGREFLGLWEEYEAAQTPEARLVKALDKLETLLQQAQGACPDWFDYAYNLGYGTDYTNLDSFIAAIRAAVDDETENCLQARKGDTSAF